jgi:ribosomal protein L29
MVIHHLNFLIKKEIQFMTCEQLKQQVESLKLEKSDLQAQLHTASPGQKPGIAAQIKAINKTLAQLKKQLEACPK